MNQKLYSFASALSVVCASSLAAQTRPPIKPVSAVRASSTDSLGNISNIRALPGGRLLVNDASNRRVLLLDSTLKTISVVADSTSSTANAYGPRSGTLIAYRGDSTLFVDAASLSMLVIDPAGKIARVMSVPRAQDAMMITGNIFGGASYDGAGRLVYRGMPGMQMRMMSSPGGSGGPPAPPQAPDSMPIVRVDLASRKVDTVSFVKIPKTNTQINRGEDGTMTINIEVNPLPVVDEWAVLKDGTIGIIRGKDYHVEWMSPDGTRSSSPKIAFDWKRLSDEQKSEFLDSVKVQRDRMMAAAPPGQQLGAALGAATGAGAGAPQPQMRMEFRSSGPGGAPTVMSAPKTNITYVSPSELPDYQPVFLANSAKADEDGHIWVRTIPTKPTPGGPVYDLIGRDGDVKQRVQLPADRTLVGFGPGGVVFLSARDGTITRLERTTLH